MTEIRALTPADLWLPGDVLDGAMLAGWRGPVDRFGPLDCTLCFDFIFPEVRDRAVRIIGPDALPIHGAEIRGEITPTEAAGLLWCSVLRREAGLGVISQVYGIATEGSNAGLHPSEHRLDRPSLTGSPYRVSEYWGRSRRPGQRKPTKEQTHAALNAALLDAGHALREPGDVLLLPLPWGVTGRLECSND